MPITTARGVALYVGALLGPGLLVLPGLAAALAGPASILAWAGLLVLSGLVAVVFARLGAAHPSAGGVAEYARLGLGPWAGRAVAWCFLAGIVTGAPVVCLMGAGYLTELLGAGTLTTTLAAGALVVVVLAVSLRGVRTSTTVQLGLVAVLVVMILAAVAVAVPAADSGNWMPFAPHGWPAIGSAATVLMLSFVGWEAIAPLTDRFADPARQLPRVIGTAFALTAVIYLGLAAATVAALGGRAGTDVPLAALLSLGLGTAGPVVAAAGAVVLTLGTANAYLTGGAALAGTLSPAGRRTFPAAILAASAAILVLIGAGLLSLETAVTVPAMFFVVVYLFCMVGAVRTVTGAARAAAMVAAAAITVVLAYAGPAVLPAVLVAALAAGWRVGAVADQVDGGLVAGDEQQEDHRGELVLGEPVRLVADTDQPGEQVVAAVRAPLGDQLPDVADHRLQAAGQPRPRLCAGDDDGGPGAERVPVGGRHAEQIADHLDGQRKGQRVDQIDPVPAGHRVQQAVGDLLDPRPHVLDPPGGERRGHQPAQAGVVGVGLELRVGENILRHRANTSRDH